MLPIRTILHPTDFSERSDDALQFARALARDYGARLILLHVAPLEFVYSGMIAAPTDPRIYRDALKARLAKVREAGAGSMVETHLREGEAAPEILRAAEEMKADLIVMGSQGRTGLSRLLLGSVAEAVLRGARCPVLTVRAPAPATSASPSPAAAPATATNE